MVTVEFSASLQRHVELSIQQVNASVLMEALDQVFQREPSIRGYVLDDQGAVRRHVTIFVNNATISDRDQLSDRLTDGDSVYVFQALSGG